MKKLVVLLVLVGVVGAVWAETYEDEVIDSFTDGTGYFKYTVKWSDISALTWLPSFGVYEALGPENWNASIGSDFTSFTTDDSSSWTQPGDVFELYSTSTEVELYTIWCRHQRSGSGRPWTWREAIVLGPALELPPVEQIQQILNFIEISVEEETLEGVGSGNSPEKKLNALINMLESTSDLIVGEYFDSAYVQLVDVLKKCDGQIPPPDFVDGEAREELANMIMELMEDLVGEE